MCILVIFIPTTPSGLPSNFSAHRTCWRVWPAPPTLAVPLLWSRVHSFCEFHPFLGALLEQHLYLVAPRTNSSLVAMRKALKTLYVCKLKPCSTAEGRGSP